MNKLPQKIKLTIHEKEVEFFLTDKREIKYYGKTKTSNESLWRTDKLEDNEVFYQSEWGWGVFVNVDERELSLEERANLLSVRIGCEIKETSLHEEGQFETEVTQDANAFGIPAKLIILKYNNEVIESYG